MVVWYSVDKFEANVHSNNSGIIFPIISRVVFDYNNFKNMNKIRLRAWLSVVMDWTWRGDKGYPYLMTLLMMVLTVGAFQVRLCSTSTVEKLKV